MFENAFPPELEKEVFFVESRMSFDARADRFPEKTIWELPSGVSIEIPQRVSLTDSLSPPDEGFTRDQALIYHCICSRNLDGHVREKHVRELLETKEPWVVPYLLEICGNYVVEILQLIYEKLSVSDCTVYKDCAQRNLLSFVKGQQRMRSYWDVYYRGMCSKFENYVGKHLFEECFGYTRSMQKLANRQHLESQEKIIAEKSEKDSV